MNVYLPYTAILPSEYQEVEYIQSSGTQYINTGYYFPSTTGKVETKFMPITIGSSFGTYRMGGSYTNNYRCFIFYLGDSTPRIGVGSVTQSISTTISAGTSYEVSVSITTAGTCNVNWNGTTSSFTYSGTIASSNYYYLFANNDNDGSGAAQYWSGRIYYFKMYDGTTLVRNFVPCYRKSDNVIGLYDLVNNQFYTNAGTGTFSKGSDVTMAELKNAYIGNGLS